MTERTGRGVERTKPTADSTEPAAEPTEPGTESSGPPARAHPLVQLVDAAEQARAEAAEARADAEEARETAEKAGENAGQASETAVDALDEAVEASDDAAEAKAEAATATETARETRERVRAASRAHRERYPFGRPGRRLSRNSPFYIGFFGALGVFLAWFLVQALAGVRQVLVLIVVSMFLAIGLSPLVDRLVRTRLNRGAAVGIVAIGVLVVFVGFAAAIVPPVAEQTADFVATAPQSLDELAQQPAVQRLDRDYQVVERIKGYIESGDIGQRAFGGLLGVGRVVLGAVFSALSVLILTLYFLSALPSIKRQAYRLAPRSRRTRVQLLGDEILRRIGGYIAGAMTVATCAGISSFVFLQAIGLQYALALALLVALLDLIPMIGATLGATVVTLVALVDSVPKALACVAFYVAYQQFENYFIYPRVMKRSVDVPPALSVVAALIGGALLGVVGALLAIPTAAAVLLIVREVLIPRQDEA